MRDNRKNYLTNIGSQMDFSTNTSVSIHQTKTAALAAGIFADGVLSPAADVIDRACGGAIRDLVKSEFKGKTGSTLVLRNLQGVSAPRIVLVGLGKQSEYSARVHAKAEQAFAAACVQLRVAEATSTLVSIACPESTVQDRARSAGSAATDAAYYYDETMGKPDVDARPKLKKISVWIGKSDQAATEKGLKEGVALGQGVSLARTLGNLPGNICTPTYLGDSAKKLAKQFSSIKVNVLDQKQIAALKMGSFLSVAKGSDQPPKFIVLHYKGKAPAKTASKTSSKQHAKQQGPVVLVGKGITFDSGGVSIKPAATMDEMKFDMCGAASVLGTFQTIAQLGLPLEVIGLIPTCENMVSGRANKPGDVVTSMSGQTIEILNTDAEGRLILCDALTYAERFKPSAVIDIATLTGACVVALGGVNSGLFSKDDALAESLLKAGKQSGDTAWRMPMDDAYQEQLKSNFADMANIGGMPAGSVTAACFLSRFTKAYRWAHLDIAGTAWKGGATKGSTGRPVPLLVQYLLNQA